MEKSFSIVIVNWNSGIQLEACIDSINNSIQKNCILNNIIIVDNNSNDNSLKNLNRQQKNLKIIENTKNYGFGKACNQGANGITSDFILFLNPDMLIFKDTFLNLFNYINHNDSDNAKIYGIQLLDETNIIQRSCARIPNLWNLIVRSLGLNKLNNKIFQSYTMHEWNHKETRIVDQVIGAFFMVKKDIFKELNGFDERFFVYYEELDFSTRVKNLGYKTIFVSEAQAYHKGGGTSENVKAKRLFYNIRSRIIYSFKHFGFFQGLFLMIFTFIFEPVTRFLFLLGKGSLLEITEMIKGFIMLYKESITLIKLGIKK